MEPIRLGVIGLGRAFALMRASFHADPRVRLVAGCDPRAAARDRFVSDYRGHAYADASSLAADPAVEAVYVASPHQFHTEHVLAALAAGRHVLVEKPLALTLADCATMRDAARAAGRHIVVGHSHGFDAPIAAARAAIAADTHGRLRMIHAVYHTDFLYRPRRPEELDSAQGGGVVFNQAPHQLDIVRLLGGGMLASVRALTGAWDPARPTEGAYAALLRFTDGAFASLTYSGYAHFDGDEFTNWISEAGRDKPPGAPFTARARLPADQPGELAQRTARSYGAPDTPTLSPPHHEHFGLILASCDHADLRPLPDRLRIHADGVTIDQPIAPPSVPRREVLDELVAAVRTGHRPLHDAAWGMATMEAALAIRESAASGQDVPMRHQVPVMQEPA